MKIENLKAEYMDDKLTYEFLHNGKVVEGCIPKVHYRASFYDVQQVEETYDTNTTTHTTSNSVLDQMNGLNQRVNTQQHSTDPSMDQPNFRSNFLK